MESPNAQHHHQEMSSQTLESMLVCTKSQQENKKPRPADQQALKCPRCDSSNTKFCYYNNYSLSQPRYFCKSCRRYWTKGGTLRNVPVGGGCRKNNRRSSSSSSSSSSSKRSQDQTLPSPMIPSLTTTPNFSSYDHHHHHHSNDISLAIARIQKQSYDHDYEHGFSMYPNTAAHLGGNTSSVGLFDAIRSGLHENSQNGFQNLYYGDQMGMGMENGGMGVSGTQEMGIHIPEFSTASTAVATIKQEMCNGNGNREGDQTRVLWGFPWQNGSIGGDGNNIGEFGWNGIGSSSNWQGLLNSPLM